MGLNATQAVRLGSITAGIAWLVLLVAPGSRADDSTSRDAAADLAVASEIGAASSALPTTVPTTVAAPTTVAPTTAPAEKLPAPAPDPPTTVAPRVYSVRDIVGVRIDRGTTWIAIATIRVVDQMGVPAAGVEVNASWNVGPTPASCSTDSEGKCSMYQSGLPDGLDVVTIAMTLPMSGSKDIRRTGVN